MSLYARCAIRYWRASGKTALGLLGIATLFVLAACGRSESGPGTSPAGAGASAPPVEVDVIVIAPTPAILTTELPGRVQSIRSAQIRARVEGILERQLVADGTVVRPGTPLFQIDARTYEAALAAAEAEFTTQKAVLARHELLLPDKAVSEQETDIIRARYKLAEAALAKARMDVENTRPRSPIAGVAGRALVTEGSLVGKGDATHLMTVEQLDPIRVEFTQAYGDVLAMQKRLKAAKQSTAMHGNLTLVLDDGSEHPYPGIVKFHDMAVEQATGTVALRAEFPNPERTLLPGTFVRLRLTTARLEAALRVPQRAVTTTAQGQSVLVVAADGTVAARTVVTQGMAGPDYLIEDGLKAGERVIVNGLQKTKPGATVKPVPVTGAKPGVAPGAPQK